MSAPTQTIRCDFADLHLPGKNDCEMCADIDVPTGCADDQSALGGAVEAMAESTRCEIADLYFWLGKEAEMVGFTPWQHVWLARPEQPIIITRFLDGTLRPMAESTIIPRSRV
jgi:hypothetical protein